MICYRIYVLNPQDRVADLIEGPFETDRAALRRAQAAQANRYAVEVWQGRRLVARMGGELQLSPA